MTEPIRRAVVTGASRGIGRAIAGRLGQLGCRVAICARGEAALRQTQRELEATGSSVLAYPCDVSVADQVDRFFATVQERWQGLDILVNNAGIGGPNPLDRGDDQRWRQLLAVNLDGVYFCSQRALGLLGENGRIINISSILGRFGVPGYTAYCTCKHGVIGFTRALALETAARKITVNAVCPGWVETRMARAGMEAGAAANNVTYQEFRQQALAEVPLQEIIDPQQVADLVAFLVSDGARNITGQAYNLCGGQVMS